MPQSQTAAFPRPQETTDYRNVKKRTKIGHFYCWMKNGHKLYRTLFRHIFIYFENNKIILACSSIFQSVWSTVLHDLVCKNHFNANLSEMTESVSCQHNEDDYRNVKKRTKIGHLYCWMKNGHKLYRTLFRHIFIYIENDFSLVWLQVQFLDGRLSVRTNVTKNGHR